MVAALRGRDSSYVPMGSLDGYANFNSLVGSRLLPGHASFPANGALPRMNTFTGFGLHGFAPSGIAHLGHNLNNMSNSVSEVGKLQGIGLPTLQGNQQGNLIQRMPAPLNLDMLQQPKVMQEASNHLLSGFSVSGVATGQSVNSFTSAAKNPQILQPNQPQYVTHSAGISNQQSVRVQPLGSDPFDIGIGDPSHSVDPGRCNETWQGAMPSTTYPGNTLPKSLPVNHNGLSSGNIRDNLSPMVSQLGSSAHNVSSSSVIMAPLADPVIRSDRLANAQNHASPLLTTTSINGHANLSNFGSLSNSNLEWEEPSQGFAQNSNLLYNSLPGSSVSNILINNHSAVNQKLGNAFSDKKLNMPNISQTSFGASSLPQDSQSDKAAVGGPLHYKDETLFNDMKFTGVSSGGFGLDDLVTSPVVKPVSSFSLYEFSCYQFS